jgi:hypothetical protein
MRVLTGAQGPQAGHGGSPSLSIISQFGRQWSLTQFLIIAGEQHINTTTVASHRFLKFERVREVRPTSGESKSRPGGRVARKDLLV